MKVQRWYFTFSAVALATALAAAPAAADEVTKWNETADKAANVSGLTGIPMFQSRIYALTQAAVHDALNVIDRRYESYVLKIPFTLRGSPEAAVATAAHDVLVNQFELLIPYGFPSQKAALDAAYASSLAGIPDGPLKTAGIGIGKVAAAVILGLRAGDGWNTPPVQDFNYPQGTAPGEYRFTPPYNFAFLPKWGEVRPFVLRESDQFQPGPPYPINSKRYTDDFNEVKRLGGNGTTTPSARTADQTQIALFWVESSPTQWNRIARTVSNTARLNLWENARLFGLLNLALADGYIASFTTKYHYKYWRPITAVREGANDGNPDTTGDPAWTSLVDTPPIPDYESAHSVEGAAGAQVMHRFFHTDYDFAVCSTTLPAGQTCNDPSPVTRSFRSFSQAAEENGLSRILVGFHFRKAVIEGIEHGRKIGDHAVNHFLREGR